MKVRKIELKNFRSATNTAIEFNDQLNVFVGVNGAGKSTILDAVSICLSWLIKRIERDDGQGMSISDSNLTIGTREGSLTLHVEQEQKIWQWFVANIVRKDLHNVWDQEYLREEVSLLAERLRQLNEQTAIWPVIVYYPVNRVVKNIRPTVSEQNHIYDLEIYENALGEETNYQAFFEWFRIQDDIANEQRTSISKWIRSNRSLVKLRAFKLFGLFKKAWQSEGDGAVSPDEFEWLVEDFWESEKLYGEAFSLFFAFSSMLKDVFKDSDYISDYVVCCDKIQAISIEGTGLLTCFPHSISYLRIKISEFAKKIEYLLNQEKINTKLLDFLWESFLFSVYLSLWEMSDNIKNTLKSELRALWLDFPKNTKLERVGDLSQKVETIIQQGINQESKQDNNPVRYQRHELQVVTSAIEQFLPGYNNLRITRIPRPQMLIDKNEEVFDLDQLSDGEKNLIVLVGDIARRLAMGNFQAANPLEGEGVIMIDEIDLHLHPNWQRLVVPKLLEIFPNCQFFISTHSPQVITHVKADSVFLLDQSKAGLNYQKADETYGMSLDRVVELVMDDESRPDSVQKELDLLFELIERNRMDQAKKLMLSLKKDMQTDPELMRAEMLIRQQEMA